MSEYRHHVSGFFANRDDAGRALATLVTRGLPQQSMQLLVTTQSPAETAIAQAVIKAAVGDCEDVSVA